MHVVSLTASRLVCFSALRLPRGTHLHDLSAKHCEQPQPDTSRPLPGRVLRGAPGPDQQPTPRISSDDVSGTQKRQALDELWLFVFLENRRKQERSVGVSSKKDPGFL